MLMSVLVSVLAFIAFTSRLCSCSNLKKVSKIVVHNFSSSAVNRSSVMDYPHPLIEMRENGSLDLSNAYTLKIGKWDKMAIAYGYQDFPSTVNEMDALNTILKRGYNSSLVYMADQDARGGGSAHPFAHATTGAHTPDEGGGDRHH